MNDILKIKNVFVLPFKSGYENGPLGVARVELSCGLFLSEMRIYEDVKEPDGLYISFPTREGTNGEIHKVYYPNTNDARIIITEAVTREYLIKTRKHRNA